MVMKNTTLLRLEATRDESSRFYSRLALRHFFLAPFPLCVYSLVLAKQHTKTIGECELSFFSLCKTTQCAELSALCVLLFWPLLLDLYRGGDEFYMSRSVTLVLTR